MKPAEKKLIITEIENQIGEHIRDRFEDVLKVKGDDGAINFGISIQVETAENGAHTVTTSLSFSEKHKFTLERDIDDPSQPSLGGEVGEAAAPKTKRKTSKKT